MESRVIKFIISIAILLNTCTSYGQGNPGFLGKKNAIGYNTAISILQPAIDLNFKNLIAHDFYVEVANKKYSSYSVHTTFSKATVSQITYNSVYQRINGFNEIVHFNQIGGNTKILVLGIGAKYSSFLLKKTVSAPVGLSHYIRVDAVCTRVLENNYIYEVSYYGNQLTDKEKEMALNGLNKSFEKINHLSLSLGYGIESKTMINNSVFVRFNYEMNISSRFFGLTRVAQLYPDNNTTTVSGVLNETAKDVTKYKNLFLFGVGIGKLL